MTVPEIHSATVVTEREGILSRVPPWLTLLVLAPVLGELVSGHQAPLEFINPLNFLLLSLPYGCGALLCRELVVRWGGGSLCLLLLGIAYGVYEEGVVVYSLFDPHWSELGAMAQYGYFAGVNWTWAAGTVQFHALVSIGASVALAHMIYPDQRAKPWLGKRGLVVGVVVLLAWIPALGSIMIFDMKRPLPPLHLYAAAWGVIAALVLAAYRIAKRTTSAARHASVKPWAFFLLGAVNISLLFIGVYIMPEHGAPPLIVTMLLLILLDAVSLFLWWRWSGRGWGWDDRHRLALVSGILAFFVLFTFLKDLESWQGSSIVGVLAILGLWQLGRTVYRRIGADQGDALLTGYQVRKDDWNYNTELNDE